MIQMRIAESYAAPEWQPKSLRRRSRELVVACPLEGFVRRVSPYSGVYKTYMTGEDSDSISSESSIVSLRPTESATSAK